MHISRRCFIWFGSFIRWSACRSFLLLIFLSVMPEYAFAHKVTIFAWVEGDMVYTESKFSGGRKAQNAPVEVFDGQGNKLLEGKTDENGEFSFKAPRKTEMKIVLVAGMGHRGEWTISVEEFKGEILEYAEKVASQEPAAKNPDKINISESVPKENTSPPCLTSEEIQRVIDTALDKKLKPVITKLNKSLDPDHSPGVSDILGGIGYIFGLVGIGAYFNYRKKSDALDSKAGFTKE
jgi:nickel transport protein